MLDFTFEIVGGNATIIRYTGAGGAVTVPDTVDGFPVTTIGDDAFRDCSGLTSFTLPNSVTTIENGAFSNCTGLTSITLPNSVTTIEAFAFARCTGLTSVTLGGDVNIGDRAFGGCIRLVVIPETTIRSLPGLEGVMVTLQALRVRRNRPVVLVMREGDFVLEAGRLVRLQLAPDDPDGDPYTTYRRHISRVGDALLDRGARSGDFAAYWPDCHRSAVALRAIAEYGSCTWYRSRPPNMRAVRAAVRAI